MARDFDGISTDYAGTIIHDGNTIVGTVSPIERIGELSGDLAGISDNDIIEFVGKVADFASEPQEKDLTTHAGSSWLVVNTIIDTACYTVRLQKA